MNELQVFKNKNFEEVRVINNPDGSTRTTTTTKMTGKGQIYFTNKLLGEASWQM